MTPQQTQVLTRTMIGLLLFRLGGEQRFTADEIDEIRVYVQGVQFISAENGDIIVRTRGPEAVQRAMEHGIII